MIKDIIVDPNPILRKVGRRITPSDFDDPKFTEMFQDLIDTMYERDGVGIAAPQIGQSIQVCAVAKDYTEDKKRDLILVNPVWQKKSITRVWGEEGCFSVPNIFGKVKRCKKIIVSAIDDTGKPIKFEANDFFARVIQHEVDHLNGVLFIDKAKDLYRIDKQL